MIKDYLLDPIKTFLFFQENLSEVNELSNTILTVLQSKPGSFHAFLPEGISTEKIHDFSTGGKTSSLRQDFSIKITTIINSNESFSCIFDDFNSDLDHINTNDLYQSHGIHYQREIYYLIHFGSNKELVSKCLFYSNTIWHSLCVIFKNGINYKIENKDIDKDYIQTICRNAVFVMIEAYDAESYIYWSEDEIST